VSGRLLLISVGDDMQVRPAWWVEDASARAAERRRAFTFDPRE